MTIEQQHHFMRKAHEFNSKKATEFWARKEPMKKIAISQIAPEQVKAEVEEWGWEYISFPWPNKKGWTARAEYRVAKQVHLQIWGICNSYNEITANRRLIATFRREMKRIGEMWERMK